MFKYNLKNFLHSTDYFLKIPAEEKKFRHEDLRYILSDMVMKVPSQG